jgi:hypothetical protein
MAGLGRVHLRYATVSGISNSLDLRIAATDAKGLTGKFDDSISSFSQSDAVWIDVEKSLLAPKDAIRATVNGPLDKLVDLDVVGDGAVLMHQQVVLKGGHASVLIAKYCGELDIARRFALEARASKSGCQKVRKCVA